MWHAHYSGAADQALEDATVQQEHSDVVAEEGHHDRKPMRRGVFQPHMGRQGRVNRAGGDFQITGIDVGPVR